MRLLELATESLPKTVLLVVYLINSDGVDIALIVSLVLALVNTVSALDLYAAEYRPELARVQPPDGTPETPLQRLKSRLDRAVDDPTATTPETMMRALTDDDDPAPTNDDAVMFDLCVLLADIVMGKEREWVFRVAVVLSAVFITCSDTLSDVSVTALYVQEENEFGVPMLVHLVVALVRGALRLFWKRSSSRPPSKRAPARATLRRRRAARRTMSAAAAFSSLARASSAAAADRASFLRA